MIFQHTWQAVLDGRKTQTRRIRRPRCELGQTRAVQPGRCEKGIARIVIQDVYQERLGSISDADARAEGFASRNDFITSWEKINRTYDPDLLVWVVVFRLAE